MRPAWAAVAALLATSIGSAAHGQGGEPDRWGSVWQGRIGSYPIRLCFDAESGTQGRGSYYYMNQKQPIGLNGTREDGRWIEHAAGSDGSADPVWRFSEATATSMKGVWQMGQRQLPFVLEPMEWSEGKWGGPCSSAAFLEPRMVPPQFKEAEKRLGDWAFVERSYVPPSHYHGLRISSFSFPAVAPGDQAINRALFAYLPRGQVDDEFAQCLSGALLSGGIDGDYGKVVEPMFASDQFLTVAIANDAYCGGAHPNFWTEHRSFDRQSGKDVDLASWIGGTSSDGGTATLPAGLKTAVLTQWNGEAECREAVEGADYWDIALGQQGLSFTPSLPHAMTPCEDTFLIDWDKLGTFLTPEGRAGRARI